MRSVPRSGSRRVAWVAIGLAVALGALASLLRFYHLTYQSLWYDELFTVVFSHPDRTLAEIVETYRTDFHPLLYPLLAHLWMTVFGASEQAIRMLSAVLGVVTVVAVVGFGRRAVDWPTGLFAGALAAVSAFHVMYSQEARNYALLTLAVVLSLDALIALVRRPSARAAVWFGIVTGLVVHTHYWGLIVAGAELSAGALVVVWRDRTWRSLGWLVAAGGVVAAICLPWLGPLTRAASTTDYWPAKPTPGFVLDYFVGYFAGDRWLALAAAVLLALVPVVVLRRSDRPISDELLPARWLALLLGVATGLTLLVPYLWSIAMTPILIDRCTIVVLPALWLLMALALRHVPGRWTGTAVAAVFVAWSVWSLVGPNRYYERVRGEQWREASRWPRSADPSAAEGDLFVSELWPGFQFYFDQDGFAATVEPATVERLRELDEVAPVDGLWLLVARGRRGGSEFESELERRYERTGREVFRKAAAEYWVRRPAGER